MHQAHKFKIPDQTMNSQGYMNKNTALGMFSSEPYLIGVFGQNNISLILKTPKNYRQKQD